MAVGLCGTETSICICEFWATLVYVEIPGQLRKLLSFPSPKKFFSVITKIVKTFCRYSLYVNAFLLELELNF